VHVDDDADFTWPAALKYYSTSFMSARRPEQVHAWRRVYPLWHNHCSILIIHGPGPGEILQAAAAWRIKDSGYGNSNPKWYSRWQNQRLQSSDQTATVVASAQGNSIGNSEVEHVAMIGFDRVCGHTTRTTHIGLAHAMDDGSDLTWRR